MNSQGKPHYPFKGHEDDTTVGMKPPVDRGNTNLKLPKPRAKRPTVVLHAISELLGCEEISVAHHRRLEKLAEDVNLITFDDVRFIDNLVTQHIADVTRG